MDNSMEIKMKFLTERIEYYKQENSQMENMFKKLKISHDELEEKLKAFDSVLNISSDTKDLKTNTLRLSQAEKLRKHGNYVSKLKICIKFYLNLNEAISKELKMFQRNLSESKKELSGALKLSTQEFHQLEEKAKKYENELAKFEKKYPWLKDKDFNLPNIVKEIDTLKALKEEKNKLFKELSVYQELKPDIKSATEQLNQLKIEHQNFYNSII